MSHISHTGSQCVDYTRGGDLGLAVGGTRNMLIERIVACLWTMSRIDTWYENESCILFQLFLEHWKMLVEGWGLGEVLYTFIPYFLLFPFRFNQGVVMYNSMVWLKCYSSDSQQWVRECCWQVSVGCFCARTKHRHSHLLQLCQQRSAILKWLLYKSTSQWCRPIVYMFIAFVDTRGTWLAGTCDWMTCLNKCLSDNDGKGHKYCKTK